MNLSSSTTSIEQSDSRYFSQRAKHISLLSKQLAPREIKSSTLPKTCFQFSNRSYILKTDIQPTPIGRGQGGSVAHDHGHSMNTGRGRTTVPSSPFVLQKDEFRSSSTVTTASAPIFVMHDEVQFVRPYFGPPNHQNTQQILPTSHKREVLLSALKEIESDLKTL